jgi:LacI family transcriptional regulator
MTTSSIKEVALRAGVSVGTVSNVLNRPEIVAKATQERVLAAIEELGFVRNEAARHLRAGRSRTVGLVVLDVANPFFTDIAHGVEAGLERHGIMTVLCNSGEDSDREARHLDQLEQQRVMGVLITPVETETPRLEQMALHGIPVVLVDRAARRVRCSVAVNDQSGGRLAVEHLLERGHRRIAFVGGPVTLTQVSERLEGGRSAVEDLGDPAATIVAMETATLSVNEGRRVGQILADLDPSERPTAAFCANDLLALGVLQQMTRTGIRVPEDMAIIGYDDIEFAAAAAVPLSSIRQPRELLGRTAVDLLLDEVENPTTHSHQRVFFEPELVARESTGSTRLVAARPARPGRGPGGAAAKVSGQTP